MTQPLYLVPQYDIEKTGAETALPEDPNQWPDTVLQELYKQVPYLADFDLNVDMENVDAERGYGLGHVEVTNKTEAPMTSPQSQMQSAGIRTARVPVIIKDSKLCPFDVVLTDDARALPLTESRLRQAMFRPQNFDVTSKTPGDQSMIGQLYPPYRQNYGFGGGGVAVGAGMGGKTAEAKTAALDLVSWLEKEAISAAPIAAAAANAAPGRAANFMSKMTAKAHAPGVPGSSRWNAIAARNTAGNAAGIAREPAKLTNALNKAASATTGSLLEAVLSNALPDDIQSFKESMLDSSVKLAYAQNPATYDSLARISCAEPDSFEKQAAAVFSEFVPSVVQVTKLAEGYAVKTASHHMWAPAETVVDRGELVRLFGTKIALATDLSGGVTVGEGSGVTEAGEAPTPGAGAGPISAPGMYQVQSVDGEMLTGVVITNLLDVDGTSLPISLFTDGQHAAVQADISGMPVGAFESPGTMPAEQASGHGCFYTDEGGVPRATLPLTLGATSQMPGEDQSPQMQAETFDGRQVSVSVQPYVATVVGVEDHMIIPQGWMWMPLDQAAEVSLAESPTEVGKVASAPRALATVQLRAGGLDCFSLQGFPVEKLASDEREFLTQDQALFVLVGLGAEPNYALQKMATACGSVEKQATVRVGHALKLASEIRGESYIDAQKFIESIPVYRHRLWKEAATISDPVAVDSVLSLGFLNPENIATYVGYLPTLDEAQRRLCELLIGSRLGLKEVPSGSVERAIRALEDTIEGLKLIAFQG